VKAIVAEIFFTSSSGMISSCLRLSVDMEWHCLQGNLDSGDESLQWRRDCVLIVEMKSVLQKLRNHC